MLDYQYGGLQGQILTKTSDKDYEANWQTAEILKGEKGEKGDKGEQGEQGIKGDKGDTGAQGIAGVAGIAGINGQDGKTPISGVDYYTEAEKQEFINSITNSVNVNVGLQLDEIIGEVI